MITKYTKHLVLQDLKEGMGNLDVMNKYKKKGLTEHDLVMIKEKSKVLRYNIIDGVEYKKCSRCGVSRINDSENYPKSIQCRKGLQGVCKRCMSVIKRNYRIVNKERVNIQSSIINKRWRDKNKEKINKNRLRKNKSIEEIERIRKKDRIYYKNNKDRIKMNYIKRELKTL